MSRATSRMKQRIDSDSGKQRMAARLATVEPVLGKRPQSKRLDPLHAARARQGRWAMKLYCRVHNIEKLGHHGNA